MDLLIAPGTVAAGQADTAPATGTPGWATDGNPATNTPATQWPAYAFNALQAELSGLITGAGLTLDRNDNGQVLKAIQAIVSASHVGILGASPDAKMLVSTPAASGLFLANQICVGTSLGGSNYVISAFNQTINLGATGAGGMDTGSAPANGYVALYAIYSPSTGAASILGVDATSIAAPIVYSGSHMPAGYTASALIAVLPTASGQFPRGTWMGRSWQYGTQLGVNVLSRSTNQTSMLQLNISAAVPLNAAACCGTLNGQSSSAQTVAVAVTSDSFSDQQQITVVGAMGGIGVFRDLALPIQQRLYYTTNAGAAPLSFVINISKYSI